MTSATCPAFYNVIDPETGNWQSCEYVGAATIQIDGQFWSRVYWNGRRKTATEYSANARSALGLDIDPTFDLDARKSRATTRNP